MTTQSDRPPDRRFRVSPQAIRAMALQVLLLAAVVALAWMLIDTARTNLADQRIASGFDFLRATAGFDVSQSLIPYSRADSYGQVFLVGLANTLLVSGLGIVLATIIGFAVGIARLSPSWMLARLAGAYVEITRNLPLLFQMLFWYLVMLGTLPGPRQSLEGPFGLFLNNRGLILPRPVPGDGFAWVAASAVAAVLVAAALMGWAS
ncbi:MAG: ABC transporter permease subunit, partial [Methylacidiphilales bacterium]|nr:ABC transporter permease subunit [Candidatus Methylacidiphilales bacterium]